MMDNSKMNPLKGQHHPQAPGALQLSCLKHRETEASLRTQGKSETQVNGDPLTFSHTHSYTHPRYHLSAHLYPLIHPSTQPYGSTHTSVSTHFPICSSTYQPSYPLTHSPIHSPISNSKIHLPSILLPSIHRVTYSPTHQANIYLLSINYEPSPISNNIYPPYSH